MLQRFILSLALALLFTFAQQGAAVHEISHYGEIVKESRAHDKSPHSHICDKCLSFSGLASAVHSSHAVTPVIPAAFETGFQHRRSHQQPATFAYCARAPPPLA